MIIYCSNLSLLYDFAFHIFERTDQKMKKNLFKVCFCLIAAISAFALSSFAADASAPSVTFPNAPTGKPVPVTITAPADHAVSSGDVVTYSIDGGSWVTYTEPFEVKDNCNIIAMVKYADGTASDPANINISCIDTTPPTMPVISADTEAWTSASVPVTITPGTDGETGIARTEYRLSKSEEWTVYTAPLELKTSDTVYARSIDIAGNVSASAQLDISNFDNTPPDTSSMAISFSCTANAVSADSGSFGSIFPAAVTARITGAKDSESGLGGYEYQVVKNGESTKADGWTLYTPESQPVVDSDFTGYIYARAYDKVGNRSNEVMSKGLVVDVTAPVISEPVLSTTALTDKRVDVTFKVTDNVRLDSVSVNGAYVGIYEPKFTAFKNGDYVVVATDKAGHSSTKTFTISNIDSNVYSLIANSEALNETDYTPSSWIVMQTALNDLKTALAAGSDPTTLTSLSDKLIASLQALVRRGDTAESLVLITKVNSLNKEAYTDTTWKAVDSGVTNVQAAVGNPESTQEQIDTNRSALELAVSELRERADFTSLDRMVSQSDALDASKYNQERYNILMEKVADAKKLSRTDTTQDVADAYYNEILNLMSKLPDPVEPEKETNYLLYFTLLILGILAAGAGIFLLVGAARKRRLERRRAKLGLTSEEYDDGGIVTDESGDIYFGGEDDEYEGGYDGENIFEGDEEDYDEEDYDEEDYSEDE